MNSTSYQKGYSIGENWEEDYKPGGPLKLRKPTNSSSIKDKIYAANIEEIEDFFRGFNDGTKSK